MGESCTTYHTAPSNGMLTETLTLSESFPAVTSAIGPAFLASEPSFQSEQTIPDEPHDYHEVPISAPISPRHVPAVFSYDSLPDLIPETCPSETTLYPRCPSLYMEVLSLQQPPYESQILTDGAPSRNKFMRIFCCDDSSFMDMQHTVELQNYLIQIY